MEIKDFKLEKMDFRTKECNDYLSLYEKNNERRTSEELFKLCGDGAGNQNTWVTSNNNIVLKFVSDRQMQERGFSVLISALKEPTSSLDFVSGEYSI